MTMTPVNAYVALGGLARLNYDRSEMLSLWPASAAALFPENSANMDMIVVQVEVDRIEIHARGVTREPFGYGRTLVERVTAGDWRYLPV